MEGGKEGGRNTNSGGGGGGGDLCARLANGGALRRPSPAGLSVAIVLYNVRGKEGGVIWLCNEIIIKPATSAAEFPPKWHELSHLRSQLLEKAREAFGTQNCFYQLLNVAEVTETDRARALHVYNHPESSSRHNEV